MTTTAATTTSIGMDSSKHSFELWGADERGKQTLHKRLLGDKISLFFANLPRCAVAMEACGSSQHWARQLKELGHGVMLLPAQHVIAYRRGGKNDRNDAQAISEAAARPSMRRRLRSLKLPPNRSRIHLLHPSCLVLHRSYCA